MSFEWVSCSMCEEYGLERLSSEVPYDRLGYAACPGRGTGACPTAAAMTDVSTPVDGQTFRASRPFTGMSWTEVRRGDRIVEWGRSDSHATIRLRRGSNTWHVRVDRFYQSVEGRGCEDEQFESEAEARETIDTWKTEHNVDGWCRATGVGGPSRQAGVGCSRRC